MYNLHNAIPDPDAVLALEPEELAGIILHLLRSSTGLRISLIQDSCFAKSRTAVSESRGQLEGVKIEEPCFVQG
jgi:hypothetical protein